MNVCLGEPPPRPLRATPHKNVGNLAIVDQGGELINGDTEPFCGLFWGQQWSAEGKPRVVDVNGHSIASAFGNIHLAGSTRWP